MSNVIPFVSSSPPPFDDNEVDQKEDDDDFSDFTSAVVAPVMPSTVNSIGSSETTLEDPFHFKVISSTSDLFEKTSELSTGQNEAEGDDWSDFAAEFPSNNAADVSSVDPLRENVDLKIEPCNVEKPEEEVDEIDVCSQEIKSVLSHISSFNSNRFGLDTSSVDSPGMDSMKVNADWESRDDSILDSEDCDGYQSAGEDNEQSDDDDDLPDDDKIFFDRGNNVDSIDFKVRETEFEDEEFDEFCAADEVSKFEKNQPDFKGEKSSDSGLLQSRENLARVAELATITGETETFECTDSDVRKIKTPSMQGNVNIPEFNTSSGDDRDDNDDDDDDNFNVFQAAETGAVSEKEEEDNVLAGSFPVDADVTGGDRITNIDVDSSEAGSSKKLEDFISADAMNSDNRFDDFDDDFDDFQGTGLNISKPISDVKSDSLELEKMKNSSYSSGIGLVKSTDTLEDPDFCDEFQQESRFDAKTVSPELGKVEKSADSVGLSKLEATLSDDDDFDDFRTSCVVASSDLQSVVAEKKSEFVSDDFDPDFDDFQDAKVWQTSDSDKGKDTAWPDDGSFQASTFPVDQSSMKSGTLNDGAWAAFDTGSVDLESNLVVAKTEVPKSQPVPGIHSVLRNCFPSARTVIPGVVCDRADNNLLLETMSCIRRPAEMTSLQKHTEDKISMMDICVWNNLKTLEKTAALRFHWSSSVVSKAFLSSINIDTRNVLVGHKKLSVPVFASNLGLLEPKKAELETPKSPISEEIRNISKANVTPGTNDVVQVEFDWQSSGLTNPLDASEKEKELLDALEPAGNAAHKTLSLETILASMSFVPTTQTASTRSKDENRKLSNEALTILGRLPDLSFMQAKVLMFPMKGEVSAAN